MNNRLLIFSLGLFLVASCANNEIRENENSKQVTVENDGKNYSLVYLVTEIDKNSFGISISIRDKNWWNCGTGGCLGFELSDEQMDRICRTENPNSYFLKKDSNISLTRNRYFLCFAEKPISTDV